VGRHAFSSALRGGVRELLHHCHLLLKARRLHSAGIKPIDLELCRIHGFNKLHRQAADKRYCTIV
jgi:hypothetical protein